MDDYKELVEMLRDESNCNVLDYVDDAADAIEDLTAALAASNEVIAKSKPCWIPVEERLPEQDIFVIGAVYHTDLIIAEDGESTEEACARCQAEAAKHPRVEFCFYGEDGWYSCDGFPMVCAPSCWMELPEPPEMEK